MRASRLVTVLSVLVLVTGALVVARPATAAHDYRYSSSRTFVVGGGGSAPVDDGAVVCDGTGGVGGVCIPWPAAAPGGNRAVQLTDDELSGVPFQVCVDNDGNGFCGGTSTVSGCADDAIVFSHGDANYWANPLQAPPAEFASGCPGGFPGWIVYVCDGIHAEGTASHTHEATRGSVELVAHGSGGTSGDFCSGDRGKPYVIAGDDRVAAHVTGEVEFNGGFPCPLGVRNVLFSGVARTSAADSMGVVAFSPLSICQTVSLPGNVGGSGTISGAGFATPAGPGGVNDNAATSGASPLTCVEGTLHGGTFSRVGADALFDVTVSYVVYEASTSGMCPGPGGPGTAEVLGSASNVALTGALALCCPTGTDPAWFRFSGSVGSPS